MVERSSMPVPPLQEALVMARSAVREGLLPMVALPPVGAHSILPVVDPLLPRAALQADPTIVRYLLLQPATSVVGVAADPAATVESTNRSSSISSNTKGVPSTS